MNNGPVISIGIGANKSFVIEDGAAPSPYLVDNYTTPIVWGTARYDNADSDVVRVRRSSDNAEADFNGTEINDGTLTTWVGANDGFVVTYYNIGTQAASDITQATTTNQARIVASGVLVTNAEGNGASDFLWDGVNPSYYEVTTTRPSQPFTTMHHIDGTAFLGCVLRFGASNSGRVFIGQTSSKIRVHLGSNTESSTLTASTNRVMVLADGASSATRVNADAETSINPGTGNGSDPYYVGSRVGAENYDGIMTTIAVIFDSDQSANCSDIFTMI